MRRLAPFVLALSVSSLLLLGLMMVYNTTGAEMIDKNEGALTGISFFKQLCYGLFGVAIATFFYRVDYHTLFKYAPFAFYTCVALLILVLIPGVGQQINGARRWLGIGSISVQPSEIMKLLFPAFYIHCFTKKGRILLGDFLKILGILALPIGLILIEPDNGTAAVLLVTLVILFFLSKVKWVYWAMPLAVFLSCALFFASQMKHVSDRLSVYLHPELDLLGKGHQPYQAKIAAGSGGMTGRGLGESLQKLSYLPEARSDYIAAIYAEECGFIGVICLLVLYLAIAVAGFQIAAHARDREGFYLAAMLTFLVVFQAFLNLGVVSGLLPSKGTNLPFFSQGGSSLVANLILVALLLNVGIQREHRISSRRLGGASLPRTTP